MVRINEWPNVENGDEARKTIRMSLQEGKFSKLKIRVVLLSDEIEGIYGPTVLHGGCLRKR